MESYDWSTFTKRIDVKASADHLYNCWTTKSGIESWFLRLSEFRKSDGSLRRENEPVEAGDSYRWLWHGYTDEDTEKGKILEANGRDFLKFTFGGNPDAPITVSVTIKTEDEEQIVELTQENIPTDEKGKLNYHFGCMQGWSFYLVNLKSILEGGIDLRNKNIKTRDVINK